MRIDQALFFEPASLLETLFATGGFDQDASHRFGRGGEEVTAAIPVLVVWIFRRTDKAEIGFMDQGGGLQRVAGRFMRHTGGGELA